MYIYWINKHEHKILTQVLELRAKLRKIFDSNSWTILRNSKLYFVQLGAEMGLFEQGENGVALD